MFHADDAITPRGPVLSVKLGLPTRFLRAMRSIGVTVHGSVDANLLIDTGASRSAFRISLFEKLGIPQHGWTDIRTPSTDEPVERPTFLVDLLFDRKHDLRNLVVIGTEFHGQAIDGLLGCDVLAYSEFTYAGIHKRWRLNVHPPPYEN